MLAWLLKLFGGNLYGYLIGGALVALLSAGASGYIVTNIKNVEIANLKSEAANQKAVNATASLQQLQSFINTMTASSMEYGRLEQAVTAQLNSISAEFRNAIKASPLPPDCKPNAVRLRAYGDAVSAVNRATTGQ